MLQHGRHIPAGEDIAGEKQDRDAVNGRSGGAGDHVGGARPDRGRAGERGEPVPHLRKRYRRMDHGLLVAAKIVGYFLVLMQSLPYARDVTVSEDAPHTCEEGRFFPIPFDELLFEIGRQGLRHGQSFGLH